MSLVGLIWKKFIEVEFYLTCFKIPILKFDRAWIGYKIQLKIPMNIQLVNNGHKKWEISSLNNVFILKNEESKKCSKDWG